MSDYNVKPYLGHKSYVDMMRTIPKSSNRGGQPDSEFEKPYMNPKGDYMDMQMNHEINYTTPSPTGSVGQVDSPLVSAAVGGGGDILMDAKGIVDGVKQDFPEVAWGTLVPLFMAGHGSDGKDWVQDDITWKILQPANGKLTANRYLATDEDSESDIIDNIMGINNEGNFSNIIVKTSPKRKVVFEGDGAVFIGPPPDNVSTQYYMFKATGWEPKDTVVQFNLVTSMTGIVPSSGTNPLVVTIVGGRANFQIAGWPRNILRGSRLYDATTGWINISPIIDGTVEVTA